MFEYYGGSHFEFRLRARYIGIACASCVGDGRNEGDEGDLAKKQCRSLALV